MSSNLLRDVRAHLRDAIKPNLPARWRIFPTLTAPAKLTVPAVYLEFTEVATEISGQKLAPGSVGAVFELAVIVPEGSTARAEDAADAAVLSMIQALDNTDGLFWGPSATKLRLKDSGQLGWSIPVTVLTSTIPEPTN